MTDLIDRQAAIEAIHTEFYEFLCGMELEDELTETEKTLLSANKAVVKAIKGLPPAQPKIGERRGKWLHDKDDLICLGYCSCCGWMSIATETEVADMPYCPNCGAKMKNDG